MKAEHMKRNRLWGMTALAVVLFVALACMPVAASVWPNYHDTTVPIANPPPRFTYQSATGYYFNLTNATAGLNALHITSDTTNAFGGAYETTDVNGVFYASDTGGRGGQDDIILMIAINSTDPTVLGNFSIRIREYGYNWTPTTNGKVTSTTTLTYRDPAIDETLDNSKYLEYPTGTDVFQAWKFAPTENYPIYNSQDMSTEQLFKVMLVDNRVGTVNETMSGKSGLTDHGMTKIVYNITSPSPFNSATTKVAFNVYAYNNQTTQGQGINWLNKVYELYGDQDGASGWLVGTSSE